MPMPTAHTHTCTHTHTHAHTHARTHTHTHTHTHTRTHTHQVCWVDSSSLRERTAEKEYLHKTQMLWTSEDHGLSLFPASLHNFPFCFSLPSNIPSSFEGRVGWVRYELFGRIVTGVTKTEHVVKIEVPVLEIIDINQQPLLVVPTNIQVRKRVWNFPCTFGTVSVIVSLARTGFCIGEDIPLNISLENGTRCDIFITASLRQKITYTAKRKKRQFDKATVVRVTSHRFSGRTSTIWPTNLSIPLEEAMSQDYELVNISYRVKVVAHAAWGQKLVAKIPITIGNIPYGESLVDMTVWSSRDDLCMCAEDISMATSAGDQQHHQLQVEMMSSLHHSESQQSSDVELSVSSCNADSACTYSVHNYLSSDPSDPCLAAH